MTDISGGLSNAQRPGGTTWNDIFWKYIRKGHDRSSAAYEADNWQARQPATPSCTSTHCERRQQCTSPHDCSGDFVP